MSEREAASGAGFLVQGQAERVVLTGTLAYRGGWRDGRFGTAETPDEDRDFYGWEGDDRRAYCRGYREGQRVRSMLRG